MAPCWADAEVGDVPHAVYSSDSSAASSGPPTPELRFVPYKAKLPKARGFATPLLGEPKAIGLWDRTCQRLGLSSRAAFRLAVVSALVIGIFTGACASTAASTLFGWVAPWLHAGERPVTRPATWRRHEVNRRAVWVYQPASAAPAAPMPAVVVLHGSYDSPTGIMNASHFNAVADAEAADSVGFLTVYPEMATPLGVSWGYGQQWESQFFRSTVDMLDREYSLKREQVFVCGHSNGGSMSLYLQNNLADLFQAAAAVEAGIGHEADWLNTSNGRPTMVVWNHNDEVLKEFGGEALYWRTVWQLRRHDPQPYRNPTNVRPLQASGSNVLYAERLSWGSVGQQPPLRVVSWASASPTHSWLNSHNVAGVRVDAAALIWEFFKTSATYPTTRAMS